jgi:hypothetical protein
MTNNKSVDKNAETVEAANLLQELKDFALTVGEDCPEGHRRDPGSGRCLPISGLDHTAFTRSQNVDDGPEWRGEVDKTNTTFANEDREAAIDADEMDEPESCAEGMTFSFVQRKCISVEEAEEEDAEEFARTEEGEPIEEEVEDAAAPGVGGHKEITLMQPEGRRDTVNHECPANMMFDYKRRECIPLNKDTLMASDLSEEFKQAVATYAKLAVTTPDPMDGHKHVATLDVDGNGVTSVATIYGGDPYPHSHAVAAYTVEDYKCSKDCTSKHPGVAVPVEHHIEPTDYGIDEVEAAAKITTKQRKGLPDSSFGVPGKRKFPLDTCGRVRNAMARFNQAKGLTSGEKATLRRKIMSRAKACGIEVRKFSAAVFDDEFAAVTKELMQMVTVPAKTQERLEAYKADADAEAKRQGPCPPGMEWDAEALRCGHTRGFVKEVSQHSDIVKHQPEGRRDPVGFQCPDGWFFDFTNRRCLPLDPSEKPGTTTTKAEEEEDAQSKVLVPNPPGKPAKLPQDCPEGTIWDKKKEDCVPLDSSKKTKSEEEEGAFPDFIQKMIDKKKGKKGKPDPKDKKKGKKAKSEEEEDATSCGDSPMKKKAKTKPKMSKGEESQTTSVGPGNELDDHGCDPATQAYNVKTERCEPIEYSEETALNAQPGNREGFVPPPAGRERLPSDCPQDTIWDAKNKICRPLSSMDKARPPKPAPSPQSPMNTAVEEMSTAVLVQQLDEIIKEESEVVEEKERSKMAAKDLPNEAFPPSLVGPTKRVFMHHTPGVEDPYDNETVDVSRLRNALARQTRAAEQAGFNEQAIVDGVNHLLYHAREIVKARVEKKD